MLYEVITSLEYAANSPEGGIVAIAADGIVGMFELIESGDTGIVKPHDVMDGMHLLDPPLIRLV